MAQVYRVLLRCPITRRVMDTGIRTSGRESLSSGAYEGGARCSECRQSHPLLPHAFFDVDSERLPELMKDLKQLKRPSLLMMVLKWVSSREV